MKLANALAERSELQTRIQQLSVRLINNAQVQEGDEPAESPAELLRELDRDYIRLEELISRINSTNSSIRIGEDTLSNLLARRDCLTGRLGVLREFLDAASSVTRRRTVGEIRIKSTVNVRELQKELDRMSKELRDLDAKIQEANWTNELI